MKRSKFSLSHYKMATHDMGELVPVAHYDVLPGDSIRHVTSALLRVSPLLTPVMHPVTVRLHHWFVPFRLIWTGWEDFITGGNDGLGGSAGSFPTMNIATSPAIGSLADYMGINPGSVAPSTVDISALPFRAYALIFNEFYRDQDLVPAVGLSKASGVDATTSQALLNVAWEKDQFTSARPWTSRGTSVVAPLTGSAGVRRATNAPGAVMYNAGTNTPAAAGATTTVAGGALQSPAGTAVSLDSGNGLVALLGLQGGNTPTTTYGPPGININDLRRSLAIQRYQEARAQYGARYVEYLRYLGIRSSDGRLDRPEYLGGGKQTFSFSEVLQTAEGTNAVGTMRGHGIAALRSNAFVRFFEEHGIVMTLASVRPKTMYTEGLHRSFSKRTKEDYYQKELELIGQQSINAQELWYNGPPGGTVIGYNDRYYEYRRHPSSVTGEFRSTLNTWHMGRSFTAYPTLNESFVKCVPTKRIHAVQSADVLWGLYNHSIQARRMLSKKVIGRVV